MAAKNPTFTTLICLPLLAGLFACSGKSEPQGPPIAASVGEVNHEDSHVAEQFKELQEEVARLTVEVGTLSARLKEKNEEIGQKSNLIQKLQNDVDSFNRMIGYGIDVAIPQVRPPYPPVGGSIEEIYADKTFKINRGKDHNVKTRQFVDIIRDGKVIGWAWIRSVSAKSCIALQFNSEQSPTNIRVGDHVQTKGSGVKPVTQGR